MKFSTKTSYGLRAMVVLSKNWERASLPLSAIAKEENISLGYLEKIFSSLKKAGLVSAEKGAAGGYRLAKSPGEISLLAIVEALEGRVRPFHCLEKTEKIYCHKKCGCGVSGLLTKVQTRIEASLESICLDEL